MTGLLKLDLVSERRIWVVMSSSEMDIEISSEKANRIQFQGISISQQLIVTQSLLTGTK